MPNPTEPPPGPPESPTPRSWNFERLFENLPISVWVEDFSNLKVLHEELVASGVTDFRSRLENDEALVFACLESVKVLAINPETLRLHEADSAEDLLDGLQSTFTPRSLEAFREELIALFEGSTGQTREAEVKTLKGQLREVLLSVSVDWTFPDWSRAYVVLTDISEQKRLQRALQAKERLHEETERVGKIGGWSIDADTREMRWTDEVFHIFGLQTEDVEPSIEAAMQHYPEEARAALSEALERCLKTGVPYDIELPFESEEGHERWTRSVGHAEIENGRVKRASGTLQDVTSRRLAEVQRLQLASGIQHNQKLKSLGALAGGIAHDFNNILSIVIGNAELALAECQPTSPQVRRLEEILSASRRAARLAGQMLSYSGGGYMSERPVELNAHLSEILAILRIAVPKDTALCFEAAPNLPVVFTDPDQVQQVLLNLVLNATEALDDGEGLIDVRLARTQLTQEELVDLERRFPLGHETPREAGDFIVIRVRDDGCGMEPETISQIFDPFYTTKFTGRGLGMAVVAGILRSHGGAIAVHSTLGTGTRIEVFLPLVPATEERPRELSSGNPGAIRHAATRRGSAGLALIADDEAGVREVLAAMLELLGYQVLTAADGTEALRRFQECGDQLTLGLFDVTMPGMDGVELFEHVHAEAPDLPVILASGYDEVGLATRFLSDKPRGFLQKPFSFTDLKLALSGILDAEGH